MIDNIEDSEAWAAFVDMRKAKGKRAPFTDLARKRILFELRRFAADGQDPEEILWTSTTNGWSGIWPVKRIGWQPQQASCPTQGHDETAAYLAREAAHAAVVERQRLARKAIA